VRLEEWSARCGPPPGAPLCHSGVVRTSLVDPSRTAAPYRVTALHNETAPIVLEVIISKRSVHNIV